MTNKYDLYANFISTSHTSNMYRADKIDSQQLSEAYVEEFLQDMGRMFDDDELSSILTEDYENLEEGLKARLQRWWNLDRKYKLNPNARVENHLEKIQKHADWWASKVGAKRHLGITAEIKQDAQEAKNRALKGKVTKAKNKGMDTTDAEKNYQAGLDKKAEHERVANDAWDAADKADSAAFRWGVNVKQSTIGRTKGRYKPDWYEKHGVKKINTSTWMNPPRVEKHLTTGEKIHYTQKELNDLHLNRGKLYHLGGSGHLEKIEPIDPNSIPERQRFHDITYSLIPPRKTVTSYNVRNDIANLPNSSKNNELYDMAVRNKYTHRRSFPPFGTTRVVTQQEETDIIDQLLYEGYEPDEIIEMIDQLDEGYWSNRHKNSVTAKIRNTLDHDWKPNLNHEKEANKEREIVKKRLYTGLGYIDPRSDPVNRSISEIDREESNYRKQERNRKWLGGGLMGKGKRPKFGSKADKGHRAETRAAYEKEQATARVDKMKKTAGGRAMIWLAQRHKTPKMFEEYYGSIAQVVSENYDEIVNNKYLIEWGALLYAMKHPEIKKKILGMLNKAREKARDNKNNQTDNDKFFDNNVTRAISKGGLLGALNRNKNGEN